MRVLRNGPVSATNQRHGPSTAAPDGAFQLSSARAAGSNAPRPMDGAAALTPTYSLLALQDYAERDRRRRKCVEGGFDLLRGLEQLHLDLLDGVVGPERAQQLADLLRRFETEADEPQLGEVLRQIELRCAVELAKLGAT